MHFMHACGSEIPQRGGISTTLRFASALRVKRLCFGKVLFRVARHRCHCYRGCLSAVSAALRILHDANDEHVRRDMDSL